MCEALDCNSVIINFNFFFIEQLFFSGAFCASSTQFKIISMRSEKSINYVY